MTEVNLIYIITYNTEALDLQNIILMTLKNIISLFVLLCLKSDLKHRSSGIYFGTVYLSCRQEKKCIL